MRLQRLRLQNFQGIRSLELAFDGRNAALYGDNATGKTTVFNAVTWLLTGGASTGAKGYTPKTRTAEGEAHNLNHIAEATFSDDGGKELTLAKDYHEVYKKKKGSRKEEFSGHTTDCFVNGVPTKEKDYAATIADICDAKWLKMLTMPQYFPEIMAWDERRKTLVEVCGDTDDAEIIAGIDGLAEILGNHTPEEYKKIAAARKTAINKELDGIPGRIDEVSRTIDSANIPPKLDDMIAEQNAAIKRLQDEYDEALTGVYAESGLQKELAAANAELERIRGEREQAKIKRMNAHKTELETLKGEILRTELRTVSLKRERDRKTEDLTRLREERHKLVTEYADVAAQAFNPSSAICPTCGREYPPEKVDEMRAKFNANKSERLTRLNDRGKKTASKAIIAETTAEIEKLNAEIFEVEKKSAELKQQDAELRTAIAALPLPENTEEYTAAEKRVEELQSRAGDIKTAQESRTRDLAKQIASERGRLAELNELKGRRRAAEQTKERIAELEARERELAAEYEATEKALFLCDEFTKAKVAALTDKINGRFDNVRFELFTMQVNGGVKECCEVLIPSPEGRLVPYAYANNAARINAGLEIIDTLSQYAGVSMPIFIDNAESVTSAADVSMQTIRLVVSESDKELRLEKE